MSPIRNTNIYRVCHYEWHCTTVPHFMSLFIENGCLLSFIVAGSVLHYIWIVGTLKVIEKMLESTIIFTCPVVQNLDFPQCWPKRRQLFHVSIKWQIIIGPNLHGKALGNLYERWWLPWRRYYCNLEECLFLTISFQMYQRWQMAI